MDFSSNHRHHARGWVLAWTVCACAAQAVEQEPADTWRKTLIPFAYYSDLFQASAGGFLRIARTVPDSLRQRAPRVDLVALGSQSGTVYLYQRIQGLRTAAGWGFEPILLAGRFDQIRAWTDNPARRAFPGQEGERFPGHNQSAPQDFLTVDGKDLWLRGKFSWSPPAGRLPLELAVEPFYRDQAGQRTAGGTLSLIWDRRDNPEDPRRGTYSGLAWQRDPGGSAARPPWSVLTLEQRGYLPLGEAGQLALAWWSRFSPSYDQTHVERADDGTRTVVAHRPPAFAGAALGSDTRLRAYGTNRFNDQAAWLYQLEWRRDLGWNPLRAWGVERFQGVLLAEAGRVAPGWDLATFHTAMKPSVGAGLRILYRGLFLRVDLAAGSEGAQVQMFVDQAF